MLHRKQIEALDSEAVAADLIHAFNAYCSAAGPSVPVEKFEDNFSAAKCSSTIPKYQESQKSKKG